MKEPCPHCGSLAIREGASKCPACKQWVGPKPRHPLGPSGVLAASLGLMAMGAVAGALGTSIALSSRAAPQPSPPATSTATTGAAAEPAPSARADASAEPTPGGGLPPFVEPRAFKLDFSPVDAVLSEDNSVVVVLSDDGSLHALSLADGKETKKVSLAGRATELRLLSQNRVALLGASGPLHLVDLGSWAVQKVDVGGGAIDAVEVGEPKVLVVASSSRRLSRFSAALKPEGQVTVARPIVALVALDGAEKPLVGVLEQGRRGGPAGAVELFDPVASPFAGARNTVPVGFEPRRGAQHERGPALLVADKGTAQLLEVSPDHPMRTAGIGKAPVAAFRLGGRWALTLDAGGGAAVSDLRTSSLDPVKTFALGGAVSRAAETPDGKTLLVALGGGAKERGATTAVVAGDPPAVVAKYPTGAGSHAVNVGRSGKYAVVSATWARTVTVFTAR